MSRITKVQSSLVLVLLLLQVLRLLLILLLLLLLLLPRVLFFFRIYHITYTDSILKHICFVTSWPHKSCQRGWQLLAFFIKCSKTYYVLYHRKSHEGRKRPRWVFRDVKNIIGFWTFQAGAGRWLRKNYWFFYKFSVVSRSFKWMDTVESRSILQVNRKISYSIQSPAYVP